MLKYLKLDEGVVVTGVKNFTNTNAQFDCSCDCCGAQIKEGDAVIGKIINCRDGQFVGSKFSATCFTCAPDWMKQTADYNAKKA